jgi:hypothetical protein
MNKLAEPIDVRTSPLVLADETNRPACRWHRVKDGGRDTRRVGGVGEYPIGDVVGGVDPVEVPRWIWPPCRLPLLDRGVQSLRGEGRRAPGSELVREEWEGRNSATLGVDGEWSGKETLNFCIYIISWLSGRMGYLLRHHLPRRPL